MLVFLVIMSGRLIRHALLVGPEGAWRDELWLDDRVLEVAAQESSPGKKPRLLTSPLPINLCSTDSLTLLPGVGPVLAGRIDDVRRQQGFFHSLEDLRKVKGIGPALSAKLETLVVFHTSQVPPLGPKDDKQPVIPFVDSSPHPR